MGLLDSLKSMVGGGASSADHASVANELVNAVQQHPGGLSGILDNFKQNGHGDVAESWIGTGPNKQVDSTQLERAIGPDVLATLSAQTGLSREELLSRLSTTLPDAVDRYTPDGRLPPTTDL